MEKMLISVSEPQSQWLREQAESLGISVSELVRRILDQERHAQQRRHDYARDQNLPDPAELVEAYRAQHPDGLLFDYDRDALRAYTIGRRRQGASWKEIKAETDYYIQYLRGITPPSVGGYCQQWPIPAPPDDKEAGGPEQGG